MNTKLATSRMRTGQWADIIKDCTRRNFFMDVTKEISDLEKERIHALQEQWKLLTNLADSYESRNSQGPFPLVIALLAASPFAIDKGLISPDLRNLMILFIPAFLVIIIAWCSYNFRRQTTTELYIKNIESELNTLLGSNSYGWRKYYDSCVEISLKKNRILLLVNPLALILLMWAIIIITAVILWIGLRFKCFMKIFDITLVYNGILILQAITLILICLSLIFNFKIVNRKSDLRIKDE